MQALFFFYIAAVYANGNGNAAGDQINTTNFSIPYGVVCNTTTGSFNQSICSGSSYLFNGNNLTTGGSYNDTLVNYSGCDSILTLNLTVNNPSGSSFSDSTCSSQPYIFNGNSLTASGTYYDTLTNYVACDSIITLNFLFKPSSSFTINQNICTGNTFLFNGNNLNTTGTYYDTLTNYTGCDSLITLNLLMVNPDTTTLTQTICGGGSYSFNGNNLTVAGTYYDTLTNYNGCDSLIILNLGVGTASAFSFNDSICSSQTYIFNGNNLTASGTYYDTLMNYTGCDSIITLTFLVKQSSGSSFSQTICSNNSFAFNGNNLTTTGTFYDTLTNYVGCDSLITLNLIVNPISNTPLSQSICSGSSYSFNGNNLTIQGTYYDTLINYLNCDSVLTLSLSVGNNSAYAFADSICSNQTYTFNGNSLTASGTYYDTLMNYTGCDSLITLTFKYKLSSNSTLNQTVCGTQTYLFNGNNLNSTGIYYDTIPNYAGCDSLITLNLTHGVADSFTIYQTIYSGNTFSFNGNNLNTAGTYYDTLTNYMGCDSMLTLILTVNNVISTNLYQAICSNGSFVFNGQTLTTGGVYLDTLTSYTAVDSILILNLSIITVPPTTVNQNLCNQSSYTFNGNTYTTSGSYMDTLVSYQSCDSIVTLNLVFNVSSASSSNQTICSNAVYLFNGNNLNTGGTYYDTLTNYVSCDSIITLNLTVNPISNFADTQRICSGYNYLFNGNLLTTAGTYYDTLTNYLLCDSIVTLTLIVNPASSSTLLQTVCYGTTYNFNGTPLSIGGTYLDTLTNYVGCDSVITLSLTILPQNNLSVVNQNVCNQTSYTWNGNTYTASGSYMDTLVSYQSCDSIVTLNLSFNVSSASSFSHTTCSNQPFFFNGNNLNIGGTYYDTLTNYVGCDSLITLTLTVNPTSGSSFSQSVCANSFYTFNGNNLNTAGTYYDTLTNYLLCDSIITLNLSIKPISNHTINQTICNGTNVTFNGIVHSANGTFFDTLVNYVSCDSFITFNLTVLPAIITNLNQSICNGNSFTFNGNNLTTGGTYLDTLVSYQSCDSILSLTLVVNNPSASSSNQSICSNGFYSFNGNNLNITGTYYDTLTNYVSCDSIITLNLTVKPVSSHTFAQSLCSGNSYFFNGNNLTSGGTYFDTLTNYLGCDSLLTLNLTVKPVSTSSFNHTMCSGNSYLFNGNNLNTAGNYNDTLTNYVGCDSVITLHLFVNPLSSSAFTHTICNGGSYLFNGNNLSAAGFYNDTLANYLGCDSIITLHLTIANSILTTINQTICNGNSYVFNGNALTTPGIYSDTLAGYLGCDSVVQLTLTVNTINLSVTINGPTITSSTIGATYQWYDCNSHTIIAGATNNSYTATTTGDYAVIITFNGCTDTSACWHVFNSFNGIGQVNGVNEELVIYPNPVGVGQSLVISHLSLGNTIRITDVMGREIIIKEQLSKNNEIRINTSSLEAGVYFIKVSDGKGNVRMGKFVKE